MSRQMKVALNLYTSETDPADGKLGDIYVNTTTTNLRVHNGTSWIDLTPASDTPFYLHTHNYDGDVDTINPVPFDVANDMSGLLSVDGGTLDQPYTDPPGPATEIHVDGGIIN
ncbi:hypothetical protein EB001_06055 [bacterium]|jgi:hypothetical protein|nr:hypothetical protein [bacterium]